MPLVTTSRSIAGEKTLQRVGWNSSFAELVGGTRSGREAFDGIPGCLRAARSMRRFAVSCNNAGC